MERKRTFGEIWWLCFKILIFTYEVAVDLCNCLDLYLIYNVECECSMPGTLHIWTGILQLAVYVGEQLVENNGALWLTEEANGSPWYNSSVRGTTQGADLSAYNEPQISYPYLSFILPLSPWRLADSQASVQAQWDKYYMERNYMLTPPTGHFWVKNSGQAAEL